MKTMRFLRTFAVLLISAVALGACGDDPDPAPIPDPDPKPGPVVPDPWTEKQTVEYDGVRFAVRSVVEDDIDGMSCVFLAAETGVTEASQLLDGDGEYVMLGVDESYEGARIDLTTLEVPFRVVCMKGGKTLFEVTDGKRETMTKGTIELSVDEEAEEGTLDFRIVLEGNSYLFGNATWSVNEEEEKENVIVVDGVEIPILSAFVEDYADYKMFTVSPVEGASSLEWIMENDADYFQMIVMPSLLNVRFDLMTETEPYTVLSFLEQMELEASPDYLEELKAGSCLFGVEETHATLDISLTLGDGREVTVRAACETKPVVVNSNTISRGGEKKPLRASFYEIDDDGSAMLWFTPGDIEYMEDIENTAYFVTLVAGPEQQDGSPVDIETTEGDFMIILQDNNTGDSKMIMPGDLNGAVGTFSVAPYDSTEPGFRCKVEMNVTFGDGESIEIRFDGECTSASEEHQKANEIVYNDFTSPVRSVIVDKSGGANADIWLCGAGGITTIDEMQDYSPLLITLPLECLDGDPAGFSGYPDMKIEYSGMTFNYDNDNVGTVTSLLEGTTLTLDFTTYDAGLSGHYAGETIVIE